MKGRLRANGSGALVVLALLALVPPDAPVADAAMRGDAEAVRALLQDGADVNAAQGDGMTALHWAALGGDVGLLDVLLHAGADVGAATRNGHYTPLHVASEAGHADAVAALLEAGSDPGAVTTSTGVTPLHLAAKSGSAKTVTVLLDHGAEIDAQEAHWGQTPLIFAAGFNRIEVVRTLVERGADVAHAEKVVHLPTRQAMDMAAKRVRDDLLATYREQASDPLGWRPTPRQVQAAMLAARKVQVRSVEEVLGDERPRPKEGGALESMSYEELVGNQGGLTPLLHAAREGFTEVAMALVDGGADIDQVSASEHASPLLIASINGHFDLALRLLERGADPTLADDAGTTPLFAVINTQWAPKARYPQQRAHLQQEATYLDVMAALLEAGADPNVRLDRHLWYMEYNFSQLSSQVWGATPFWRAAFATDVDAMKLLVEHGADPTIPTLRPPPRGREAPAASRAAAAGGELDPSGIPPVPVGGPGIYPIHAASGVGYGGGDGAGRAGNSHRHVPNGWLPAVRYLVDELGADVNTRDHNGYTALHWAAARGDNEVVEYLVGKGADVMAVSRKGQTTVDMANGPVQRIQPFPATIEILEGYGAINNHNCVSC